MATSQLQIYNNALRLCKERKLASLADDREARYLLDDVWDDNAIEACLESGLFSFALRTGRLDYDPSIDPDFGYRYVYDLPADFVQLNMLASDELFNCPMLSNFSIEGGRIYTDLTTIFISYVSKDAQYGLNLQLWPKSFADFVSAYLAKEIVGALTGSQGIENDVKEQFLARKDASLARDAIKKPMRFQPFGSWVRARLAFGTSRENGGSYGR